jgi:HK97 family phage major capsid protein
MTKALDIAIVKGPGTASPLGITLDTRITSLTKHVVTLSATEFQDWSAWKKKVFSALSASYKAGATFLMASGTFEGYIDGMVDANGQPIGRVNYGITNGPQESFGGRAVIEVEDDVIANYDDAAAGDVVAIYGNLTNYAINSNMSMTMFRYLDQNTNEYVDKAILIADGKTLDANAFVIVKKGA